MLLFKIVQQSKIAEDGFAKEAKAEQAAAAAKTDLAAQQQAVLEKQAAAKEAKKNSKKLLQDAEAKATLPTKEERAEKRRKLRAALGGAGAGDIALYLKRLFNEKGPDDDDIACLAGLISVAIVDSDEEESDPQPEPQPEPAVAGLRRWV